MPPGNSCRPPRALPTKSRVRRRVAFGPERSRNACRMTGPACLRRSKLGSSARPTSSMARTDFAMSEYSLARGMPFSPKMKSSFSMARPISWRPMLKLRSSISASVTSRSIARRSTRAPGGASSTAIRTTRSASPSSAAIQKSAKAWRRRRVNKPASPQSRKHRRPSWVMSTLPACGSAWKNPVTSTWCMIDRAPRPASSRAASGSSGAMSAGRPSISSMTSKRAVVYSLMTSGAKTFSGSGLRVLKYC